MNLNFSSLLDASFWTRNSDSESKKIPIVVIYPSGRSASASSGHLALISDTLFVPEIVSRIIQINSKTEYEIIINSMLDIDFYNYLRSIRGTNSSEEMEDPLNVLNSNIITIATADINIATKLLLDESNSFEEYNAGFKKPYEDCVIIGTKGKRYSVMAYPNVGVLGLYKVPWSDYERFAIMSGGILAPGSLASNLLLFNLLSGEDYGNNQFMPKIPLKIVSSYVKDYNHIKLIPTAECIPQHELRNITKDLTIHE